MKLHIFKLQKRSSSVVPDINYQLNIRLEISGGCDEIRFAPLRTSAFSMYLEICDNETRVLSIVLVFCFKLNKLRRMPKMH